ncbi:aaa domain protein, partial [Cystoisospora suis]
MPPRRFVPAGRARRLSPVSSLGSQPTAGSQANARCSFECTYTSQKTKKNKSWKDGVCTCEVMRGFLRVLLYAAQEDDTDSSGYLQKKGDPLDSFQLPPKPFADLVDEEFEMPLYLVQLTRMIEDHSNLSIPTEVHSKYTSAKNVTGEDTRETAPFQPEDSATAIPRRSCSVRGVSSSQAAVAAASSSSSSSSVTMPHSALPPRGYGSRGGLFSRRAGAASQRATSDTGLSSYVSNATAAGAWSTTGDLGGRDSSSGGQKSSPLSSELGRCTYTQSSGVVRENVFESEDVDNSFAKSPSSQTSLSVSKNFPPRSRRSEKQDRSSSVPSIAGAVPTSQRTLVASSPYQERKDERGETSHLPLSSQHPHYSSAEFEANPLRHSSSLHGMSEVDHHRTSRNDKERGVLSGMEKALSYESSFSPSSSPEERGNGSLEKTSPLGGTGLRDKQERIGLDETEILSDTEELSRGILETLAADVLVEETVIPLPISTQSDRPTSFPFFPSFLFPSRIAPLYDGLLLNKCFSSLPLSCHDRSGNLEIQQGCMHGEKKQGMLSLDERETYTKTDVSGEPGWFPSDNGGERRQREREDELSCLRSISKDSLFALAGMLDESLLFSSLFKSFENDAMDERLKDLPLLTVPGFKEVEEERRERTVNPSLISSNTTSHPNASSTGRLVSTTSKSMTSSSLSSISSSVLYTRQRDDAAADLGLEIQSENHRAPCHQPFLKDALPSGKTAPLNASSTASFISPKESSTSDTSSSSSCVSVLKDQRTSNSALSQEKSSSSATHPHTVAHGKQARKTGECPREGISVAQQESVYPQKASATGPMFPNSHMTRGNVETKHVHRQQASSFLSDTSVSKPSSFSPPPVSTPSSSCCSFSTSSGVSRASACQYPSHPRVSESANPPYGTSQTTRFSARPSFRPPMSLGSSSLSSCSVNTADKPSWTASSSSLSSLKSFSPAGTKNSMSMLTQHSDSLSSRPLSSFPSSFTSHLGNKHISAATLDRDHPGHQTSVGKRREDQNARGGEEGQGLPFFTPLLRLPPINLASRGGGLTARHQLASLLPVRFAIPQDPQKVTPAMLRQCIRGFRTSLPPGQPAKNPDREGSLLSEQKICLSSSALKSSLGLATDTLNDAVDAYCLKVFNAVSQQVQATLFEIAADLQPLIYTRRPSSTATSTSNAGGPSKTERPSFQRVPSTLGTGGNISILAVEDLVLQVSSSSSMLEREASRAVELKFKRRRMLQQKRAQYRRALKMRQKKQREGGGSDGVKGVEDEEEDQEEMDREVNEEEEDEYDEDEETAEEKQRLFLGFTNCHVKNLSGGGDLRGNSRAFDPLKLIKSTASKNDIWALNAAGDWSDASNILLCRSCWKGLHPRTSSMEVEIFSPSQLYSTSSAPAAETATSLSLPSASSSVLPKWWMKGGGGTQGYRGSGGKRVVSGILLGNFSNEFAAVDGIERLWKASKLFSGRSQFGDCGAHHSSSNSSRRNFDASSFSITSDFPGVWDVSLCCLAHGLELQDQSANPHATQRKEDLQHSSPTPGRQGGKEEEKISKSESEKKGLLSPLSL